MKRPLLLLLVTLTGCHRVTGLDGPAGQARHGNGYHILSIFTLWLAVVAMAAGTAFVARALFGRRDRDQMMWRLGLSLVGLVLFLGTTYSSFGLWTCHGTC